MNHRRGGQGFREASRIALPAVVAVVVGSGCFLPRRGGDSPPPARQSAARDTLLAADLARSEALGRSGYAASMRPLLHQDVIYLRPGAHATYGGDLSAAALAGSTAQNPGFTAWQPLGGGLSRDALAGYTFGIAVRAAPEPAPPLIERYIAFWTRTSGGAWRIAAYIEIPAVGVPSPAGSKPAVSSDSSLAVRAMLTADSGYAEVASLRGPAVAAREMMSEDGVLLTTTQLVAGPRAASDYFESQRSLSLSWIPRDARIAASGDLGFTIGDALATSGGPTGAVMQRFTKYLTVWRREPDGRWRAMVTGANDRPSPIGD